MADRRGREFDDRRDRDERRRAIDDIDLNETKTLWMGDINIDWDERDIEDIFRDCGEKVIAKHPMDGNTGRPAKYCFVEFETQERAERFLDEYNGKKIPGSKALFKLNIRYRRDPDRRPNRGGPPGRMGDRELRGGRRSPDYGSRSPARDRTGPRDRVGDGGGRDGSASPARWNPSDSESRSGSESQSRSPSRGRGAKLEPPSKRRRVGMPAERGREREKDAGFSEGGRREMGSRRSTDTGNPISRDRARSPEFGGRGDRGAFRRSRSPDLHGRGDLRDPHSRDRGRESRRPRVVEDIPVEERQRSRDRTRGDRDIGSRSRREEAEGALSETGSSGKRRLKKEAAAPVVPPEPVKYIRVTLKPGNRMGELPPGIPLMKVLNDYVNRWRQDKTVVVTAEDQHFLAERPIVGALVNGRACAAGDRTADYMHSLAPIFIDSHEGHAIYRRSVMFLAALACSMELPTYRAVVSHVAREGVVIDLVASGQPLLACDTTTAEKVERGMKQLAKLNLPITQTELAHRRALTWFTIGFDSKHTNSHTSKLIRSRHDPLVPCHKCSVPQADSDPHEFLALDFGPLTPTTGMIEDFSVELAETSLMIKFDLERPTHGAKTSGGWQPVETPLTTKQALWQAVKENAKWKELHGLGCAAAINVLAAHSTTLMKERVALSEGLHEMKIHDLASTIALRGVRLVALSGPAGGGSEAVLKRLNIALSVRGLRPMTLQTSDFVQADPAESTTGSAVGADSKAPASPPGLVIDDDALVKCISTLAGETATEEAVVTPTGTRIRRTNGVLIVHGPHAFNQELIGDAIRSLPAEQVYRIYVEPFSQLNVDDLLRVSSNKVRLLRIVAQEHTLRQASARKSIQKFSGLQAVDETHLFPYQDAADVVFNSSLPYDVPVLKPFVAPLLRSIPPDSPDYCIAQSLTTFLSFFESFSPEMLPDSSILREYISKA